MHKPFVQGTEPEIYLLEAAKAIAALSERSYVLPKDVEEAAVFVLPHRMRKPPEQQQEEQNQQEEEQSDQNDELNQGSE